MRENRPYGSEGGEVESLPYPYQWAAHRDRRQTAESKDVSDAVFCPDRLHLLAGGKFSPVGSGFRDCDGGFFIGRQHDRHRFIGGAGKAVDNSGIIYIRHRNASLCRPRQPEQVMHPRMPAEAAIEVEAAVDIVLERIVVVERRDLGDRGGP